jgi:hypothetical protein
MDESSLTAPEQQALQLIRAIPEGPLQHRALFLLQFLTFYVMEPRCQKMGVDGFPCDNPRLACDDCHKVWDLLDSVETTGESHFPV